MSALSCFLSFDFFFFFFFFCNLYTGVHVQARPIRTLWRCGDGLFFEVPLLASDALLTTLHPLLENVLQTVDHFEISCLGAPISWLEEPTNLMGARPELNSVFGLEKLDRWNPIRTSTIQSRSRPMRFLGFSNHKKGAPGQDISK
jgi:hypothetical protein